MDKQRIRITYLMVAAALCLAAWAASATPRLRAGRHLDSHDLQPATERTLPAPVSVPKARPKVEVVFALDTTGSMSGLIDGAKRKIWSIAQFIASGQPRPDLRVGLVAYRDLGDAYVTRFYDLSDDLDKVFERLSSFEAAGGGDTPEHVSKALYDAVYRASWSTDQATLKQVYLVGDAPPHTDYSDGFNYRAIAKHAHDLGIHINTIRCGGDRQTELVWNEISDAASGEYASIDQSGGMMAVATPYDDKLAELNRRLVGTAIGYGLGASELRAKAARAGLLDKESAAARASVIGGMGGGFRGEGDLGRDVAAGLVSAVAVPMAALPPEMQPMAPARRAEYVAQKNAERARISDEIKVLAKQRSEYLKDKAPADSFDAKVEATISRQAKSVGVRY
jgi:hypothetical protein